MTRLAPHFDDGAVSQCLNQGRGAGLGTESAQAGGEEGDAREERWISGYASSTLARPSWAWPVLASRPADLGAHSAASYCWTTSSSAGSLNTYGDEQKAFSDEAQQIGLILASHASVAAEAALQRDVLEDVALDLHRALLSRDVIGQAKGILMERLKLTPDDAFDALRQASSRLNEKLHGVALGLAETGELNTRDTTH